MSYEGYVQMLCANGHYQTDEEKTDDWVDLPFQ